MTRIFHIPYAFNVPAGTGAGQSSNPLDAFSQIIGALLIFPPGTGSAMTYQFTESPSRPTDSTVFPGGLEISAESMNPSLYVGDGIAYPVPWQKQPQTNTRVINMWAQNNGGSDQYASAVVWLAR